MAVILIPSISGVTDKLKDLPLQILDDIFFLFVHHNANLKNRASTTSKFGLD